MAFFSLLVLVTSALVVWWFGRDSRNLPAAGNPEERTSSARVEELAEGLVTIDGHRFSLGEPAYLVDGVVMLPMRETFALAGARITYEPYAKRGIATSDNLKVAVVDGYQHAQVGARTVMMDHPAMIIRGSLYVSRNLVEQVMTAEQILAMKDQLELNAGDVASQ